MSFTLKFYAKTALATFKKNVINKEITKAFIEMIETISVDNLKYIVFDLSDITFYEMPEDYKDRVKTMTHFSTFWNAKIDVLFVATNTEVRFMATAFVNHEKDLIWNYHLFDSMETAKRTFIDL